MTVEISMNYSDEWLLEKAKLEDNAVVSVGGLVSKLAPEDEGPDPPHCDPHDVLYAKILGRLVEMRSRELNFSLEELARSTSIELEDMLGIVTGCVGFLEARNVHQLSAALDLPAKPLLVLSGLTKETDGGVLREAMRFAARSESFRSLSSEEHTVLDDFVRFLVTS